MDNTCNMGKLKLSGHGKRQLREVMQRSPDGKLVRRAQMLLWLADGIGNKEVADRMQVSRQSVYELAWRFEQRCELLILERLKDEVGRGRPAYLRKAVKDKLQGMITTNPETFGYRTTCWTVPMMKTQLRFALKENMSVDTIRRALKEMRFSYKRPRFVLSRQSPTWRNAKGGFAEA